MSGEPLLKVVVKTACLGLAGFMLAVATGCKSSSSASSRSPSHSTVDPAQLTRQTPIAGSAAKGKELFQETCTTCHGMHGQGVPHLGADLQTSKFVASSTDAQLVAFIEQGRAASDPMNKMHVAMPPKGGNPALSTQDLYDIVAFLREIQKKRE